MQIRNEDVGEVVVEVPEGHTHVRTIVRLSSGEELTLQEATVSNIVRAFVAVKTHPQKSRVVLRGRELSQRKPGFAAWQLLEEEQDGGA